MLEQMGPTMPAATPHRPAGGCARALPEECVRQALAVACGRVCPVWDIKSFIAANSLQGFEAGHFRDAAVAARAYFHAEALMPAEFYRDQYRLGRITSDDLDAAVRDLGAGGGEAPAGARPEVRTLAERIDQACGTGYEALIARELCKWCAAYFDQGQAAWALPGRDRRFFACWRDLAAADGTGRVWGLGEFAGFAGLPESPLEAVRGLVAALGVPPDDLPDYLTRLLTRLPGWSGYAQHRAQQGESTGDLTDLVAVGLAYECSLVRSLRGRLPDTGSPWESVRLLEGEEAPHPGADDLDARLAWQGAYERAFRRDLLGRLSNRPPAPTGPIARPAAQAVFCIDVRSEVLRRHLERQGEPGSYQTLGFAGFFAFPIAHVAFGAATPTARCPALLRPRFTVADRPTGCEAEQARAASRRRFGASLGSALAGARYAAVSSYFFVESLGLLFGAGALLRAATPDGFTRLRAFGRWLLGGSPPTRPVIEPSAGTPCGGEVGIPLEEQVATARAALGAMGLVDNFARLVLLCGHGSSSDNNPYAAALDCGACGGHEGKANARVAALVFNDPRVRARLAKEGIVIPDDTYFVAAQHDTTTDEVEVFDKDLLPPSHAGDLAALEAALARAGAAARQERQARFNGGPGGRRRSRDWSEVRPEWGLVGTAAFIVAPRELTAGVDLQGRAFLHSYDHRRDPGGAALEVILTAPLVVAAWINLQYYLSTVDNRRFGSGDKAIHNVVGKLGVMQGNHSDLQVGLPLQSVSDGERLAHEPLRLTAVVQAGRGRVEAIIRRHDSVRRLADNEWITLVVLEPDDGRFYRYRPGGCWAVEGPERAGPHP